MDHNTTVGDIIDQNMGLDSKPELKRRTADDTLVREHKSPTGSITSNGLPKTLMTRRQTTRQQSNTQFNLKTVIEEEPLLMQLPPVDEEEKITAQDILLLGNTVEEPDYKYERREPKEQIEEKVHDIPIGGVKLNSKYWVPKQINPLKFDLTKEQLKDLKEAFDYLENPKMGMVKIDDISTLAKACGFEPKPGEIKDLVEKVTQNSSGVMIFSIYNRIIPYVDLSEYLNFDEFVRIFKYEFIHQDPIEQVERAFKLMNVSKTGRISLDDLREVSKLVNYELADEEMQQMINEANPGSDGCVTIDRFKRLVTRKQQFDDTVEPDKKTLQQEKPQKSVKRQQIFIGKTNR